MISQPVALILASALDAVMGDPAWMPHPVRLIGRFIEKAEPVLRDGASDLRREGMVLAALVVSVVGVSAFFLESVLRSPSLGRSAETLGAIAYVYLVSTTIAYRGLMDSVRAVLKESEIEAARERLSHIVGRDTSTLDMEGVRRAALETLAENTSDGIIAPLFYYALGGLPLAFIYKAVNTLDSMVGYKNEKYIEMGWASARLDDLMNYIPARLTGILIAAASVFVNGAGRSGAMVIMRRDGRKHTSPNAGVPEAAMAGALGIRLGGPSYYQGILIEKPFIGDETGKGYEEVLEPGLRLVSIASVMGICLAVITALIRISI